MEVHKRNKKEGLSRLLPLLSQNSKTIAIGKVEGDYDYQELTPDIKHIRPIKWLSKNILKSEFGEDIIKQLQIPMTVYQIKLDDIINTIKKVLQNSGTTDVDIDEFNLVESDSRKDKEERINYASERETKTKILERSIYLTGYDNLNLQRSKEYHILGWKDRPSKLSTGDYVFVFNTTGHSVWRTTICSC